MPTTRSKSKRRGRSKSKRRGSRRGWTRKKRVGQNLTRDVRWFKVVKSITSNAAGNFREVYNPNQVDECFDFENWAKIWEEFKVVKMIVRFMPSSVGSESLQEGTDTGGFPSNRATFKRGDTITWVDQGSLDAPTNFNSVIIKPSARMVNPRYFHKRWADRPKGNPTWGQLDSDGSISLPDEWNDTRIQIFGTNFSPITDPGDQTYYYVVQMFKVIFRGRQEFQP